MGVFLLKHSVYHINSAEIYTVASFLVNCENHKIHGVKIGKQAVSFSDEIHARACVCVRACRTAMCGLGTSLIGHQVLSDPQSANQSITLLGKRPTQRPLIYTTLFAI